MNIIFKYALIVFLCFPTTMIFGHPSSAYHNRTEHYKSLKRLDSSKKYLDKRKSEIQSKKMDEEKSQEQVELTTDEKFKIWGELVQLRYKELDAKEKRLSDQLQSVLEKIQNSLSDAEKKYHKTRYDGLKVGYDKFIKDYHELKESVKSVEEAYWTNKLSIEAASTNSLDRTNGLMQPKNK